jgi:hypothetical protein
MLVYPRCTHSGRGRLPLRPMFGVKNLLICRENDGQADAQIRTGDPFITSEGSPVTGVGSCYPEAALHRGFRGRLTASRTRRTPPPCTRGVPAEEVVRHGIYRTL